MLQEAIKVLSAHAGELLLGFALLVSEVLGSSDKFKSSSVFELVKMLLQKLAPKNP
jgi:hypothetical protein